MSDETPATPAPPSRPVLRIARWGETVIEIHASMILLLILLAWGSAVSLLPAQEGPTAFTQVEFWLLGIAATIALLACVVAHELAHVVVARWRGLRVERVTLFFHAAHSPRGDAARTPIDELLVAASGPFVTLVIAIACWLGADALAAQRHASTLLELTSKTNFVLVLAHLLPGLPLDGGRIVHAIAWGLTDDRHRGTKWAGRAGVAFAALLATACAFGIAVAGIGTAFTIGLVLALALGLQCAGATRMARFHERLEGVVVRDVMEPPPAAIPRITSVADALQGEWLRDGKGAWLVEYGGRLGAMVTLAQLQAVPEDERQGTPVGQVATRLERQHLLAPLLQVEEALRCMVAEQLPLLPVIEGGILVGVLRQEAIFRQVDAPA